MVKHSWSVAIPALTYFFACSPFNPGACPSTGLLYFFAALGGAICGLIFHNMIGLFGPFMGMTPSILALIVVFGLINPEATIYFMLVLPIKAKYISYGTIVITLLTILAKANPYGAYHLGGMLFGYIYFKGPKNIFDPNVWYLKYLQWQYKRKKGRFTIVDGDKKDEDKPTYH